MVHRRRPSRRSKRASLPPNRSRSTTTLFTSSTSDVRSVASDPATSSTSTNYSNLASCPSTDDFGLNLPESCSDLDNDFTYPDPMNPLYIKELDDVYDRAKKRIKQMEDAAKARAKEEIPPNKDDSCIGDAEVKQQMRKENNTKSMARTRLWRQIFAENLEADTEQRCKRFRELRRIVDQKFEYLRQIHLKLQQECSDVCETLRPSDFENLPESIRKMCIAFNLGPRLPEHVSSPSSSLSTAPLSSPQNSFQNSSPPGHSSESLPEIQKMHLTTPIPSTITPNSSIQSTPSITRTNVSFEPFMTDTTNVLTSSKIDAPPASEKETNYPFYSIGVFNDPLDAYYTEEPQSIDQILAPANTAPTSENSLYHRGVLDDVFGLGSDRLDVF